MTNTIQLVSADANGNPATTVPGYQVGSQYPSISGNGRFVAFISDATNLAPLAYAPARSPGPEVYVKDLLTGSVTLASSKADGTALHAGWNEAAISEDGTTVVFSGLDPLDYSGTNYNNDQVYAKNLLTGNVTIISQGSAGQIGNANTFGFSVSSNGNEVAFVSQASNLLTNPYNFAQAFLKNVATGDLTILSQTSNGTLANNGGGQIALSGNGNVAVFTSSASNLAPGTTYGTQEIYAKNILTGALVLVSATVDGVPGGTSGNSSGGSNGSSSPSISDDGVLVEFTSGAANLTGDESGFQHVLVKNLLTGALTVIPSPDGASSVTAQISPDGKYIIYGGNGSGAGGSEQVDIINIATGAFTTLTQDAEAGSTASSDVSSFGHTISADDKTAAFETLSPTLSPAAMVLPDGFASGPSVVAASVNLGTLAKADDFTGSGTSDILWHADNGDTAIAGIAGDAQTSWQDGGIVPPSFAIAGAGDFNGDGTEDILWHAGNGDTTIANYQNGVQANWTDLGIYPTAFQVAGVGDFNGDASSDILWQAGNGDIAIASIRNDAQTQWTDLGIYPTAFQIAGVGDFNDDGTSDILFHAANGDTAIASMVNDAQVQWTDLGIYPTAFQVAGVGDFNGDGTSDILWHAANGDTAISTIKSDGQTSWSDLGIVPPAFQVAKIGDFNGDGTSDILWHAANGATAISTIQGAQQTQWTNLGTIPSAFHVAGSS